LKEYEMHQDMPTYPPIQFRATDGLIQVIAVRLDNLHADVSGMRDVLKELATAVTKLAVIEERQGQAAQALERAFKVLEKVEARLDALEHAQPLQMQSTDWINRGMWAAVGVLALFIIKKVGLV
jgi:uncharacterized coiled-coil protein SlyX